MALLRDTAVAVGLIVTLGGCMTLSGCSAGPSGCGAGARSAVDAVAIMLKSAAGGDVALACTVVTGVSAEDLQRYLNDVATFESSAGGADVVSTYIDESQQLGSLGVVTALSSANGRRMDFWVLHNSGRFWVTTGYEKPLADHTPTSDPSSPS